MLVIFLLVQILFESLPVSSSGHAVLFSLAAPRPVDFVAHLFAWSVFVCYLLAMRQEIFAWWRQSSRSQLRLYINVLLGVWFFTALGLLVKPFLLPLVDANTFVLGVGFALTSAALLSLYGLPRAKSRINPSVSDMAYLAAAQVLALLLPGVSRMGLVFAAASWLGWSGTAAWYWMIVTAFPLFAGAGLLGVLNGGVALIAAAGGWVIWPAMFGAFCLSIGLFFWAAYLARTNRFWLFGGYTLFVTLIVLAQAFFG